MHLSHTKRLALRDLGWSIARRKAERPPAVPTSDMLRVGEDVRIDGGVNRLVRLDARR